MSRSRKKAGAGPSKAPKGAAPETENNGKGEAAEASETSHVETPEASLPEAAASVPRSESEANSHADGGTFDPEATVALTAQELEAQVAGSIAAPSRRNPNDGSTDSRALGGDDEAAEAPLDTEPPPTRPAPKTRRNRGKQPRSDTSPPAMMGEAIAAHEAATESAAKLPQENDHETDSESESPQSDANAEAPPQAAAETESTNASPSAAEIPPVPTPGADADVSDKSSGTLQIDFDDDEVPTEDAVDDRSPEVIALDHLKGLLEALIFASDKPLKASELSRVAGVGAKEVKIALDLLRGEYSRRGIRLDEVASGFIFRTSTVYSRYVRDMSKQKPVKLTRSQVETLAILAYRQPITRPEIDEIRGVDSGPVLKMLLERNLVRILGKKDEPGRPLLYGTTPEFLEFFGLKSLRDMPTLREFTELNDDSRMVVEQELGELLEEENAAAKDAESVFGNPESPTDAERESVAARAREFEDRDPSVHDVSASLESDNETDAADPSDAESVVIDEDAMDAAIRAADVDNSDDDDEDDDDDDDEDDEDEDEDDEDEDEDE